MTNPPKRDQLIRRLVATARAIVTYQVGLSVGCVRMSRILNWLEVYSRVEVPIFDEYLTAVRHLPISSDRLHWNVDALRAKDQELEAINSAYRNRVFDACFGIIETFASPEPPPREDSRA